MFFSEENQKKREEFFESINNSYIYSNYYKKIDENLVYLESRDGNDFTGNILRIVEELSTGKYGNFKINLYVKPNVESKVKSLSKNYNLKIDKIITNETKATKVLENAKYIFTDSGIRPKYVKRDGQIFVNTWHGTPLKVMGFDNTPEEHRLGNIQHPFLSSDYLIYPNDYMMNKMLKSYMIDKLYSGKILLEGYPRNSVFFNESWLKEKLTLTNYEIFVYMPTFRGILMDKDNDIQKDDVEIYLTQLDSKLKDNQLLFVKLHVFNESRIDFEKFRHVKPFPEGYEIYDVLNMADVLITDYSSVFFDFANSRRKIILFNYDEEEYMSYRGTYFPISELPFPKVQNVDDLIAELNSPKQYDDSKFLETFCQYDNPHAVKNLCNHIFKNQNSCNEKIIQNDKPNILIFAGALFKNGLTSSLVSILSNMDTENYNIYLSFRQWEYNIRKNHEEIFKKFPSDIKYLPIRSELNPTVKERRAYDMYLDHDSVNFDVGYPKILDKLFQREINRIYPSISFDKMIHFDGYGDNAILFYKDFICENAIWVHNDMVQESKTRQIQKLYVLKEAYSSYDNVVAVSPDLIKSIDIICDKEIDVKIVHNIGDYKNITEKSKKDVNLDKNTIVTTNFTGGINDVLNSDGKKFITIGRFSPEKGHERLLLAFDEFCKDYPDTQLIIIGGHGSEYKYLLELRNELSCWKNITIIKSISNPMPILKKCDLFVLPSFYEGWPMVLMEADILNIPIIATDIIGTQWMKDYGGYVVGDSQKEILQGFYDFMDGKVKSMDLDYEEYNNNAVNEFINILN